VKGKKIMVEYAHPNTHKEMHIGHMRTLITGEALSRIFEASGATVFRANYQGDIGPHVAKALYGIEILMKERGLALAEVEKWNNTAKAHFLGEGYVRGNKDYEAEKEVIDSINTKLYQKDSSIQSLYEKTRGWSLDYYEDFYKRFYTHFDKLFFESEVAQAGKRIVEENVGKVFRVENGATIFPGEHYGLHTRVFITQAGNPTYEGKEMGNAEAEYKAFPFDLKMHIVASEQAGYFQVVFKALDLIDPEKFVGRQHHLSMGMVTLTDRKMSSRTGDVLTVDWLIDQVRARVEKLATEGKISSEKVDETIEMITIGAIKYSVLRGGTGQNVAFDIETSVSLDGNSGPYLQYTYARTQSILTKSGISDLKLQGSNVQANAEELQLLRKLSQFNDVVVSAAENYAPNHLATYLFELAQGFNNFYQKHKVIGSKEEDFRLSLVAATGNTLKRGLMLLGIHAPEKM
jgi:arginyl-tRNA synthetase